MCGIVAISLNFNKEAEKDIGNARLFHYMKMPANAKDFLK